MKKIGLFAAGVLFDTAESMKCIIRHESRGRLRVHLCCARMTLREADLLEYSLRAVEGVTEVKVYGRTQDAVVLVGVDASYAEMLPGDKANFIREEKVKGHTVIMIGDGVNDSPALSEADAAIAREIADITIGSEDLFALVTLRRLSETLMARIHQNYRTIVGFNLMLIILGVAGLIPPTTSALLHNASTLGISLHSMTSLLPEEEKNN